MARSRLTELRRGSDASNFDEEAGEIPLSILNSFIKESNAINKVLVWADEKLSDVSNSIRIARGEEKELEKAEKTTDEVEKKLRAVRARLSRMASENREFVKEHQAQAPGSVQTRLVQYRKMGQNFLERVDDLSKIRTQLRDARRKALDDEVLRINPGADVRALAAGRLEVEQVINDTAKTARTSAQLETIRQRNRDINKMAQGIAELHELFQDMSVLVNSQQDMINQIEYNVQETKEVAEKTVDELEKALSYKKKASKRRRCITATIIIVILLVLLIVGIFLAIFITNRRRAYLMEKAITS